MAGIFPLKPSASASTTHAAVSQPNGARVKSDNPFLEPPARKLHKQHHEQGSTYYSSLVTASRVAAQGEIKQPLAVGAHPQSAKPKRLVLTRVQPSNSVVGAIPTTASPNRSSSTVTAIANNTSVFLASDMPRARPRLEAQTPPFHSESTQHPSTTPKAPPNREYYDFIMKGLEKSTGFEQRLEAEGRAMADQVQALNDQGSEQEENEKHLEPRAQMETEESIPVNSTIMAFARKSIMQHASSSPQSIFRKLSTVKGATKALSNTTPRTGPSPNATTSSFKSPIEGGAKASKETGATKNSEQNVTTVPTMFTFVSRPKGAGTATASVGATQATTPTFLKTRRESGSKTSPSISESTRSTPTTTSLLASVSSTPIFSRSVLNFSQSLESKEPKKRAFGVTAASTSTPSPNDTIAQPRQPAPVTLLDLQLPTPSSGPGTAILPPAAESMDFTNTKELLSAKGQALFDLRSALRNDSARNQYQLPSLIASLSPPASPKRRPSPYTIPSAHERDALRFRRMPRFKARPLNPKVFTSAGDLGVPRIPKQPLTVPVSPVFSKPRTRNAVVDSGLTKESAVNSDAARRLKSMIKVGVERKFTARFSSGHGRIESNRGHRPQAQPRINTKSNRSPGAAGISKSGTAASAAWTTPLVVPNVDQMRATMNLGSIKGPPMRQEIPDTPTHAPASIMTKATASSTAAAGADAKRRQGPLSKLHRPVTRPKPFTFATTELQRRRMLFQPTTQDATRIASTFVSTSTIPVTDRTVGTFPSSSSNTLTLQDL